MISQEALNFSLAATTFTRTLAVSQTSNFLNRKSLATDPKIVREALYFTVIRSTSYAEPN